MLQAGIIHLLVSEMAGLSEIVGVNVCEPSCELADSFSQNSLPGGSYIEVNTDMKKALRGEP